jgi:hypothetical protein
MGMYKIETTAYGFRLTFGGLISKPEMERWVGDSQSALKSAPVSFGVLIDMRTLTPLSPDVRDVMQKGQALFKKAGMQRSCVVLESSILTYQFKEIAKQSGIYAFERYVSASTPGWENLAVSWIRNAADPDHIAEAATPSL